MNRIDWANAEAHNQAALLAHLGSSPLARGQRSAEITWVVTGVDSNDYNGAVWTRLTPARADTLVPEVVGQLRASGAAALWHIDPPSAPADLPARLAALGCRPLASGVCMAAPLSALRLDAQEVSGLVISPVRDRHTLRQWMAVWTADGEERPEPREPLYASLGLDAAHTLQHWLAHLDGVPVGTAQTFTADGTVGLYCVGVLPELRRRGIGRALVAAALRAAQHSGAALAVLGPSQDGQPLYTGMGFQLLPSAGASYVV